MQSSRAIISAALLLACGCSPAVALEVSFADAPCVTGESALMLAIERGGCGETAGVLVEHGSTLVGEVLEPGAYCVDAMAYRTGSEGNGHVCRADALARVNRRLPDERTPIVLSPVCAAPSPVSDGLLASTADCNATCDVRRCICSLACDVGCVDGTCGCPAPINVERLVIGDDYVCGLAADLRSLTCWGDGARAAGRVDGWTGYVPGVATRGLAPTAPGEQIVLFDGDSDQLCTRTDMGHVQCTGRGTSMPAVAEVAPRNACAVGRNFQCIGELSVVCGGATLPLAPLPQFEFVSRISAGHAHFCAISRALVNPVTSAAVVRCIDPSDGPRDCGAACPWWSEDSCPSGVCSPRVITPVAGLRPGSFLELDLGWERGCAIDSQRQLYCWSFDPADPDGVPPPTLNRDVLVPLQVMTATGAAVSATEVSVGAEHICIRVQGGSVECGRLALGSGALVLASVPFPGSGQATSFVAGPHGISCAVRTVEDAPNRVECFQLDGFTGGEGLLGRAHTRDLEAGVDGDAADLAVCP